jgi:hypothetical protein
MSFFPDHVLDQVGRGAYLNLAAGHLIQHVLQQGQVVPDGSIGMAAEAAEAVEIAADAAVDVPLFEGLEEKIGQAFSSSQKPVEQVMLVGVQGTVEHGGVAGGI